MLLCPVRKLFQWFLFSCFSQPLPSGRRRISWGRECRLLYFDLLFLLIFYARSQGRRLLFSPRKAPERLGRGPAKSAVLFRPFDLSAKPCHPTVQEERLMRKVVLTALFLSLICATAFAATTDHGWPTLKAQIQKSHAPAGSALEKLIQENQDFSLLRPEEAYDNLRIPLWLRVHWRKAHP